MTDPTPAEVKAGEARPYPDLLSDDEQKAILGRAEDLWADLQANNLGGFSGINRPFWIAYKFKSVIETFGRRDVGLSWSKDDLEAAKSARPATDAGERMWEAIAAGLKAFESNQADFTMSPAMRTDAAEHILSQPGMWSPSPATDAGEGRKLREALIAIGRAAGCFLADDVSTDFLLLVPAKVKAALSPQAPSPSEGGANAGKTFADGLDAAAKVSEEYAAYAVAAAIRRLGE